MITATTSRGQASPLRPLLPPSLRRAFSSTTRSRCSCTEEETREGETMTRYYGYCLLLLCLLWPPWPLDLAWRTTVHPVHHTHLFPGTATACTIPYVLAGPLLQSNSTRGSSRRLVAAVHQFTSAREKSSQVRSEYCCRIVENGRESCGTHCGTKHAVLSCHTNAGRGDALHLVRVRQSQHCGVRYPHT